MIRNRFKIDYIRQNSYADTRRLDLKFEEGDKEYQKISPMKGVVRFDKICKLNPLYIVPYGILQKSGDVAYVLRLPSEVARFIRCSMSPLLRIALSIPSPSFVLRVMVWIITSPMNRLWWN